MATQLWRDDPLSRGCAEGTLTIVGSTAFQPVARDLGEAYQDDCRDAHVTVAAQGSGRGTKTLIDEGEAAKGGFPAYLAFSDGPDGSGDPRLTEHLVALSVFSVVVNKDVRISDLSLDALRRLYSGRITNWSQLPGGPDLPVRLVGRDAKSGTRGVFESRVLGGGNEISRTSDDCRTPKFSGDTVVRCELDSTSEVLQTVANTPGAIGYADCMPRRRAPRRGSPPAGPRSPQTFHRRGPGADLPLLGAGVRVHLHHAAPELPDLEVPRRSGRGHWAEPH
ncbi:substrate-binding domain-containing protein [Streptomyces hygroscopicus]|uniref:substrate-binding domain-containing protein n=1 Tax=Streptomyces hygroscopicus TaxID=1912 RepID=UPI0033E30E7A